MLILLVLFIESQSHVKHVVKTLEKQECPTSQSERIEISNSVSLTECVFKDIINDTIGCHGGAIQVKESIVVSIESCNFTNINIKGDFASGGAIYAEKSDVTYKKCRFENCSAYFIGGAITNEQCTNTLIESCIFQYCSANSASGCKIQYEKTTQVLKDSVNIKLSKFIGCYHETGSDTDDFCTLALDFEGDRTIAQANILYCTFQDLNEFAILCETSYFSLNDTTFMNINNKQQDHSSCVHCLLGSIAQGRFYVVNTNFVNCVTQDYGIMNVPNVALHMEFCNITNCASNDVDNINSHGLMITDSDNTIQNCVLSYCYFIGNKCSNGGSGLYIDRDKVHLVIESCNFIDNVITNEKGSNYGASVHSKSSGTIIFNNTKLNFYKTNDATNVVLENSPTVSFIKSCFNSTGPYKYDYYHLISSVTVTFIDTCYNKVGIYGFKVPENQNMSGLLTNCDDCQPFESECPAITDSTLEMTGITNMISLRLLDCKYNNILINENDHMGGGMKLVNVDVHLRGCSFDRCSNKGKGSFGGAIYSRSCYFSTIDCSFTNCNAEQMGGAVFNDQPLTNDVYSTTFRWCSSKNASAIRVNYKIQSMPMEISSFYHFEDCNFKNCNVSEKYDNDYYCALALDFEGNRFETRVNCSIKNCLFERLDMNAILSEVTNFDLLNSTFINVKNMGPGHAVCVHCLVDTINNGNYNVIDTIFRNCDTNSYGIMNIPFVNLTMRNCTVSFCNPITKTLTSTNSHALTITDVKEEGFTDIVNIIDCTFEKNSAKNGGAGIYADRPDKTINVINCLFYNNYIQDNDKADLGGDIHFVESGNILFSDCAFISNIARYMSGAPSLRFEKLTDVHIKRCTFKSIKKTSGKYYIVASDSKITFDVFNCYVNNDDNLPKFEGFTLPTDRTLTDKCSDDIPVDDCSKNERYEHQNSFLHLDTCNFSNVKTTGNLNGGILCVNYNNPTLEGILYIKNCEFIKISCEGLGGAIYTMFVNTTIIDCIFTSCNTTKDGGALYSQFPLNSFISNAYFEDCQANHCSVMKFYFNAGRRGEEGEIKNGEAFLQKVTIAQCRATANETGSGEKDDHLCAIALDYPSENNNATVNATLIEVKFDYIFNNFAILSECKFMTILDCYFEECINFIQNKACCIYCLTDSIPSGQYIMNNVTFINCITDDYGVMNVPNVGLDMRNCIIQLNQARDTDNNTKAHCFMITDNDDKLFPVIIDNVTFRNNQVPNGGALYIDRKEKNVSISNCRFQNNVVQNLDGTINYGANIQTSFGGYVEMYNCYLQHVKQYDESNILINDLDKCIISQCCFDTLSFTSRKTCVHIKSNIKIDFYPNNCFNDMGDLNFNWTGTEKPTMENINFNCENCLPKTECTEGRKEYNNLLVFLDYCSFSDIVSQGKNGGAVYCSHGNVLITHCSFFSCQGDIGGAFYLMNSSAKVSDSYFDSCSSEKEAGCAMLSMPNTTVFQSCFFSYCNSQKISVMKILVIPDYDPTNDEKEIPQETSFFQCQFNSNSLPGEDPSIEYTKEYCVLYIDYDGDSTVMNTTFVDVIFDENKCYGIYSSSTFLTLNNSLFNKCTNRNAEGCSSCVYVEDKVSKIGFYNIYNTNFTNCETTDYGVMNIPSIMVYMIECRVYHCTSYDNDQAKNAHGFYITGYNAQPSKIINCTFEETKNANGGALYIDSEISIFTIISCKFLNNVHTNHSNAINYGANFMSCKKAAISFQKCQFTYKKDCDASSVRFEYEYSPNYAYITMNECCFMSSSNGNQKFKSVFNIYSTTKIEFKSFTCISNNSEYGINNQFVPNQDEYNINYNCEGCMPIEECMTERKEYKNEKFQLSGCSTPEFGIEVPDTFDNGGLISATSCYIILKSCTINGIYMANTKSKGGALYLAKTTSIIQNCMFSGCQAHTGGAIYIYYPRSSTIEDTKFLSNSAFQSACVYFEYDINSDVSKNKSGLSLKASPNLYSFSWDPDDSDVSKFYQFINCEFYVNSIIYNSDTNADYHCALSLDYQGSEVASFNIVIKGCKFGIIYGGGFAILCETGYLELTDTLFDGLGSQDNGHSSCLHTLLDSINDGKYIITNVICKECSTDDFGIMNIPCVELEMKDCIFLRNSANDVDKHKEGHGIMITDSDKKSLQVVISNVTFKDFIIVSGGALYVDRAYKKVKVENCLFEGTIVGQNMKCGANIHVKGTEQTGSFEIIGCRFNYDKTPNVSSIYIEETQKSFSFTLLRCCFNTKWASVEEDKSPCHIFSTIPLIFKSDCCFNTVLPEEGPELPMFEIPDFDVKKVNMDCDSDCIPVTTCDIRGYDEKYTRINIHNCSFRDISSNDKSVIRIERGKLYVTFCTFSGLSGANDGGAIYSEKTQNQISNSRFIKCSSDLSGGAISALYTNYSLVKDCTFSECSSQKCAACWFFLTPDDSAPFDDWWFAVPTNATIIGCTFKDCTNKKPSKPDEEDYYCTLACDFQDSYSISSLVLSECVFQMNKGFAVLSEASFMTLSNTLFRNYNNDIQGHASCVHCLTDSVDTGAYTLYNTTFYYCTTQDFGVMNVPNVGLDMQNCKVSYCSAYDSDQHKDAHGFMITDYDHWLYPCTVKNCIFEYNNGANGGGGLYIDRRSKDVTVESCLFMYNDATYSKNSIKYGANLQVIGNGKINVTLCKFYFSKSNDAASVLFDGLDSIYMFNNCFNSNSWGSFTSAIHLVSDKQITFDGNQCFNNVTGKLFSLPDGQNMDRVYTDCDEYCYPKDECPKEGERLTGGLGANANLYLCTFSNVIYTESDQFIDSGGGVISLSMVTAILRSCTFTNVSITNRDGGAVYLYFSSIKIYDTKFRLCTSGKASGAISVVFPDETVLENVIFDMCDASNISVGQIIFGSKNSRNNTAILKNVDVKNVKYAPDRINSDYDCCFAIDYFNDYNSSDDNPNEDIIKTPLNATIINCVFSQLQRFALLLETTNLTMINTLFDSIYYNNPKQQNHSCCVHCILSSISKGYYHIENTSFLNSYTNDFGPMNVPNVKLDMINCYFNLLTVTDTEFKDGHGLMITDDDAITGLPVTISNCEFYYINTNSGGALYMDRLYKEVTVKNCKFIGCGVMGSNKTGPYTGACIMGVGPGNVDLIGCEFKYSNYFDVPSIGFKGLSIVSLEKCCFETNLYGENKNGAHLASDGYIDFKKMNCYNDLRVNNFKLPEGTVLPSADYLSSQCRNCEPETFCYNFTYLQRVEDKILYLFNCNFIGVGQPDSMNGVIYAERSEVKIEMCRMFSNQGKMTSNFNFVECSVTILNSNFQVATSQVNGAVVSTYPKTTILVNTNFSDCRADSCSAIWIKFKPDYDPDNDDEEVPQVFNITRCHFKDSSLIDPYDNDYSCLIGLDTKDESTVIKGFIIDCSFRNLEMFAILSEMSFLAIQNTIFDNIVNKMQRHASAVHCLTETVHFGKYYLNNVSFTSCETQDFGVMNVPNVELDMELCIVKDCYSYDSDEHVDAHGFMITDDDDQMLTIYIQRCIFANNEAANGGAGLYINRKEKNVFISNCNFTYNSATYDEKSSGYGANIQALNSGAVTISNCNFDFEKTNKAASVLFNKLDRVVLISCCFNSIGKGVENSPFHIISDTKIIFNGYSCFNDKKDNFKFVDGQNIDMISLNCADICKPIDECPQKRKEYFGKQVNLYKCDFSSFRIDTTTGQKGGVIKADSITILIDNCLFTSIVLSGKKSCGGALYFNMCINEIKNSKFIKCESEEAGGAIDIEYPSKTTLYNDIFSFCSSKRSSAVKVNYDTYLISDQLATLDSCLFKDCFHKAFDEKDYYCCLSLDFEGKNTLVNATITNCKFVDIKSFAVLSEISYLDLENTTFQNCVNDQQELCSCVHCLIESVKSGKYKIYNTSFIDCVTEDYGVMNIPNVNLDMQNCQVIRCTSTDSDKHVDAHGIMLTDDDNNLAITIVKNCLFEDNKAGNGGAGMYIDRNGISITIESCKFISNQVTYTKDSAKYGANLQVASPDFPMVTLNACKFVFNKINDACSVFLSTEGWYVFNNTCFNSDGVGETPFHIVSVSFVDFIGYNCFNDKDKYNFKFSVEINTSILNFNCAENCIPADNCPILFRFPNQTNALVNLVGCAFMGHSVSGENGKNGGAVYVKKCELHLISCTFQQCKAIETSGKGGAVYSNNSPTEIIECKFTLCECNDEGGAVYLLWPQSGGVINNCIFVRCKAGRTSALKLAVPDDSRDNEYRDEYDTSVTDCLFKENFASIKGEGYCCVNIECSSDSVIITTNMLRCRFQDMNNFGMYSENSYLTLKDTIIQNLNSTVNTKYASGVHCNLETVSYGYYTIANTTFSGLSSDDFGVMNVPNIELDMRDCLIKDCKSFDSDEHKNAHGFMITDTDDTIYPCYIENCIFQNNDGANGGGGLYIDRKRKDITIYSCQFIDNQASYDDLSANYGANLQVIGIGKINITKCKFSYKKYNSASSISFTNLTKIIINNCCFNGYETKPDTAQYITSNTNITFIGVQCVVNTTNLFSFCEGQIPPQLDFNCDEYCIPNKTCTKNKRNKYSNRLLNIDRCSFENVGSSGFADNGGAISLSNGVMYIRNTYFSACFLSGMDSSGGAIFTISCENHIYDCKFATCNSYKYGGALVLLFPNVTDIQRCTFVRCTAMRASACYISVIRDNNPDDDEFEIPQVATLLDCVFRDNYHNKNTEEGFEDYYCTISIDFDLDSTSLNATIKNSQFFSSKEFALLSEATYLTLENVIFQGVANDIQGHASCVHCLTDTVKLGHYVITNTSFINCITQDFGVMNVPNVALDMTNCVVKGCNSSDSDQHKDAHGFMVTDNDDLLLPVNIINCVFENNDGANGGAGLFIDRKQKDVYITNCVFKNNKASYSPNSASYGVSLQVEGSGKISITKSKFIYTKVNDAANTLFQGLDEIILNNNCFISNGIGNTPFHIISNTIITFTGSQHCFNQNGDHNFQLPANQKIPDTVKFTCDEYCVPADVCPTAQTLKYSANVNIVRCKFNNIKSNFNGGIVSSVDCIVSVIESTFTEISCTENGGAIHISYGEAHIYGCQFDKCNGRVYGGSIYNYAENYTDIQNCSFTSCTSKRASALFVSFYPDYEPGNDEEEIPIYASIINCHFSSCKNTALETNFIDYYCTLSLDFVEDKTVANATVANCSFTDNTGFGILCELSFLDLINTVFVKQNNDKAGNHSSCVHCLTETVHFGEYNIKNVTFSECSTDDYGVMNIPNVILHMSDCMVSKCKSTDSDTHINAHGFMITDDDDQLEQIDVSNCIFEENDCANGGALYINRKLKNIVIDSCTFINNKASYNENSDKYGASLQVEGSGKATFTNCKFVFDKSNKASSVKFDGLDQIFMARCCFQTKATSTEGYFHIWSNTIIRFTDYICFNEIKGVNNDKLSYFVQNQNTDFFDYNCDEYCIPITACPSKPIQENLGVNTLNIKECKFLDTQPTIITTIMGRLIIRNSQFRPSNESSNPHPYSSAINAKITDVYLYDCTFEKCNIGEESGAIYTLLSNITVFEKCTFTECSSNLVAAVSLDMVSDNDATNDLEEVPKLANFTGCKFIKCSHKRFTAELANLYCTLAVSTATVNTVVELNLMSCQFNEIKGFGVYSTASFMTMQNTVFQNIDHEKSGYASCVHVPRDYVHFGSYNLFNTQFLNCRTNDYGVMNVPNVGVFMTGCLVRGCVAHDSDQSVNGHGFMITDDDDLLYPVVIEHCQFEDNDASNGGAGLYIDRKQKSIYVSNCQFSGNKVSHNEKSKDYGVNIQVVGTGVISINKCTFNFVKTNDASSVLFANLNQIVIDSCNFNSEGSGNTPFHIVSNTLITFKGTSCMNDKGSLNFKFAEGQTTNGISFNCNGGGGDDDSQHQGNNKGITPGGLAGVIIAVVIIIAIAIVAIVVFLAKKGFLKKENETSEVYHADKEASYSEAMSTATFETSNTEHVFDDEL